MNDPYLYDNVNILKNKFNIKDKEILNQMEAEFTNLRIKQSIKQILDEPIKGEYDFEHFCKMHYYIF